MAASGFQQDLFPTIPQRRFDATVSSWRWAEKPGNWDRLNARAIFPRLNDLGFPALPATQWLPAALIRWNDTDVLRTAPEGSAIHFFIDDYRFEPAWNKPGRLVERAKRAGGALTPDFSMWTSMPPVMQMWQTYRNRWCGAWLHVHGVPVIPTVGWSTPESFAWCFDGLPEGSHLAISAVGVRDESAHELFRRGLAEMVRRLTPTALVVYGPLPDGLRVDGLPMVHEYPTFRRGVKAWAREAQAA